MSTTRHDFSRCVIVVNPVSSNYDRGQRLIRQLTTIFPGNQLEIIEMRHTDYERPSWLITRLNAAIDKSTLLAIAGGDGTNNLIVDTILRSSAVSEAAQNVVILPLWAGNANDLAHMANGNPPNSIESIIQNGLAIPIYPLSVTTKHASKTNIRLAVCYVSLGASAYASARISNPSHRSRRVYRLPGGRMLTEMASVTRAFIGAPTFDSTINDRRRRIYDIAMINGSRIAKVNRIPIKLTDRKFYEILVDRKHPFIVSYFIQIVRGISVERRTRTERILTLNEATWAQVDGEALQIPRQTEITVKHYNQPFYLLSTKLTADSTKD
jgi:diacylglycerol kinase family enzyme